MRWFILLGVLGMCLPAIGSAAQILTPMQATVDISSDTSFSFKLIYTLSAPEQGNEAGLGLRIHFNSKAVQYQTVTQVFAAGLQPISEVMADTADWDADTNTDSYIVMAWVDINAQWPGTSNLPLTLLTMQFQPVAGFKGVTYIRSSATSTAVNTPFQSTPMKVAVGQGVQVQLKAFLQGAYDVASKQMRDNLRTNQLLPIKQPYSAWGYNGSETINESTLLTVGYDAPVDWVLVQLHDTTSARTVVAAQAALLQRNGNVADAASNQLGLHFPAVKAGNYYISLQHRNHLGVMTNVPIALGSEAVMLDFSALNTPIAGTNPTAISANTRLLWAGDISRDNKVIGEGPGNDKSLVLNSVLADQGNSSASINYQRMAYINADINLDGKIIFAGPGNDINTLLSNILLYPGNTTNSTNYILQGGLGLPSH